MLEIGMYDAREVDTIRRMYAGQAMRAQLTVAAHSTTKGSMPRLLSKEERTLIAVQSYLVAEAMIDAEGLQTPELEEMLKELSSTKA